MSYRECARRDGEGKGMTLGYHFLFSNWIEKNGTEDNNNDLSDSGKPNLNSRFRGPTLGVHLTRSRMLCKGWIQNSDDRV